MHAVLSLFAFLAVMMVAMAIPQSYLEYDGIEDGPEDQVPDRVVYGIQVKRVCVPSGGNCDYRSTECCYSTYCRCNLWGANCRCQIKGLLRACVARGGNCDHRGAECCQSTACRCNLWGANCRCQRKGLFAKLG